MASVFIEPLNFRTILINFLLGNSELFLFAFILFLCGLAGRFNMSPKIFGTILVVSVIMMGNYLGVSILLLVGVLLGILVYTLMRKFMGY
jgi:hypothetical protein